MRIHFHTLIVVRETSGALHLWESETDHRVKGVEKINFPGWQDCLMLFKASWRSALSRITCRGEVKTKIVMLGSVQSMGKLMVSKLPHSPRDCGNVGSRHTCMHASLSMHGLLSYMHACYVGTYLQTNTHTNQQINMHMYIRTCVHSDDCECDEEEWRWFGLHLYPGKTDHTDDLSCYIVVLEADCTVPQSPQELKSQGLKKMMMMRLRMRQGASA